MSSPHAQSCQLPSSQAPQTAQKLREGDSVLVIRPYSGLSGDIMVAGLAALCDLKQAELDELLDSLGLGQIVGRVRLGRKAVHEVSGVSLEAELPEEDAHRHLKDIQALFKAARLEPQARDLALRAFELLAEAEGEVHGRPAAEVHFHEVGALDSIMDMGLCAILLTRLAPEAFICGPLPLCDGEIQCRHGLMPSPAPAVQKLLTGVPVISLASRGETVTPTALALLKAAGASFGPWPPLLIQRQALAYGSRYFPGVPNGAIFAYGPAHNLGGRL